jgi:hypothetical protein
MRRSTNVRDADWRNSSSIGPDDPLIWDERIRRNVPVNPDISTGAFYQGGVMLMNDLKNLLRRHGILSENTAYRQFGLSAPQAPGLLSPLPGVLTVPLPKKKAKK